MRLEMLRGSSEASVASQLRMAKLLGACGRVLGWQRRRWRRKRSGPRRIQTGTLPSRCGSARRASSRVHARECGVPSATRRRTTAGRGTHLISQAGTRTSRIRRRARSCCIRSSERMRRLCGRLSPATSRLLTWLCVLTCRTARSPNRWCVSRGRRGISGRRCHRPMGYRNRRTLKSWRTRSAAKLEAIAQQ